MCPPPNFPPQKPYFHFLFKCRLAVREIQECLFNGGGKRSKLSRVPPTRVFQNSLPCICPSSIQEIPIGVWRQNMLLWVSQ